MKPSYTVLGIIALGILIGMYASRPTAPRQGPWRSEADLWEIGRSQSAGLDGATVHVHSAAEFEGKTWIEPLNRCHLICVDVEFTNYQDGFDLDDVDVIDAESNENLGSNPDMYLIDAEGNPLPQEAPWPEQRKSIRVLLIYAVPDATRRIKLGYWNKTMTPEPILVRREPRILDFSDYKPKATEKALREQR
jgi:hypothetical protein